MRRLLVLGGGFGGLAAAHRLRREGDPRDEVVLVARDTRFAMGWSKIDALVGARTLGEASRDLRVLADRGVRVTTAEVTEIAPGERAVATTAGDIEADGMVVALGAAADPGDRALLDGTFAHDVYSFDTVTAAASALSGLTHGRLLLAVLGQPYKCPPAPFEAVLAVDEALRRRGVRDDVEVTMATPAPHVLGIAGDEAGAIVTSWLDARDIELLLDTHVTGTDPSDRRVVLADGSSIEVDLVLGVPRAAPPPVVATGPLAGADGWVHPDPRTMATAHDRVYAVGDVTHVPIAGGALPKAGVFAAAQGTVAAANLLADLGQPVGRETFDGTGFCFLQLPDGTVALVEGDFTARPRPQVRLVPPSVEALDRKHRFETERMEAWFGG